MSEIAAGTTVTESAPTSTADVASAVIDAYEQPADGVEVSGDTPTPEPEAPSETPGVLEAAPETPEPAKVVEELTEAAKFLQQQGHQAQKPDGRETWFRFKTVEKMLERYAGQHRSTWDGARGELERERDTYKADLDELYTDVRGEPKAFLEKLSGYDPRYKTFLETPAAPAHAAVPDAKMPEPDVVLNDGSRTYSLEGLQKLLEWNTAQVESRLMPKVDERLKPLTEREQQAKQREESDKAQRALEDRVRKQVQEAESWPNWADYKPDVEKLLQEDTAKAKAENRRPSMTLKEAYWQVRATSARGTVLNELKNAPKAPAVTRSGGETPKPQGPVSTADIAARTLARLERGA